MRKWRCDGYNQDHEKLFTVGNVYCGDENGMKSDDGFCYSHSKDIDKIMGFLSDYYKFTEVFDEKEEVKMNKFKVGDVVRIIKNVNSHCFKVGDIVEIYEVTNDYARCRRIGENQTFGHNVWFYDMELIKEKKEDFNTKTLTITTSDTTTTLTDGTYTTSINRYHTDKHNERNVVSIVIDKYYDELAEIERLSKLPKVGDKVKVVDHGKTHSTYDEWLIKNNVNLKSAIKWRNGLSPKNGGKYTIKEIHKHEYYDIDLALIEDADNAYIMNIKGLEVIK